MGWGRAYSDWKKLSRLADCMVALRTELLAVFLGLPLL